MSEEIKQDTSIKTTAEPKKNKRVWEIDFIRGVAILGMVVDHFIFDLSDMQDFFCNFSQVNNPFFNTLQRSLAHYYNDPPFIRQYFHNLAVLFFILCGISCTFSHNNFRHAGKIFLATLIIDSATYIIFHITYAVNPSGAFDFRILFGVLFSLAMGTLAVALIQLIPHHKWILLGLGLSIITYGVLISYLYVLPQQNAMPKNGTEVWYSILKLFDTHFYMGLSNPASAPTVFEKIFGLDVKHFFLSMIGLIDVGSDYFSTLPWIGFTLIGAFIGETAYKDKKSLLPKLDGKWHHFFDWVGSKTIWIYLFHQPFNIALMAIVCCPFGYRFF